MATKTALITGGSKGIGYGIAESMLKEGYNVLITARSEQTLAEAYHKLHGMAPGKVAFAVADVRSMQDMQSACQKAVSTFGSLDVLVANAGIGHFASIEDLTAEKWKDVIDINLTGVFNTIKPCIEELKKSKGYFITIASLAGTNFFATGSAYNASKFGLVGFTQAVMLDLRKYGVKATTIMPGSVSTYFNDRVPTDAESWKIQPEDIGKLVVDILTMHPRTLPSKIEVRPTVPPSKS